MRSLSSLSGVDTVQNVVVFIADSLRFDSLPESVRDRGVTARTVSASTFTASSLPSMMTGVYPSTHRVWNFDDVVGTAPKLLSGENAGIKTQQIWTDLEPPQRPPLRTLRQREQVSLSDVESPFTLVIHDRGAHGPYNYFESEYENSPEFFSRYSDSPKRLHELYQEGAEQAGNRFLEVVEDVSNRFDPEKTLFVFTSDHGELLGETNRGGIFAHGTPMCLELVEVPTVFMGAGLPHGERLDGLLSGVDLAPTLLGAQSRSIPSRVEGINCWETALESDRIVRSEMWDHSGRLEYGAVGVWTEDGGIVDHRGRMHERIAYGVHRQLVAGAQAPAIRQLGIRQYLHFLRIYGHPRPRYGDPDPDILSAAKEVTFEKGESSYDVETLPQERLEALGYLE